MKNNQEYLEMKKNSPRERLLELEKEGKYLFHGSDQDIEILEPMQAYEENEATKEMEKDGDPAVFATEYADVAIFRALTTSKDIKNSNSYFGVNDEKLSFGATRNLLDHAREISGRVYILNKNDFEKFRSGIDYRSSKPSKPIDFVEVTADDLPENIEIMG